MIKKAQSGAGVKAKPVLKKKKMQTPADFEPKSKFPLTPGGGDNYDETIKRERELKKKGMMKMGGKMKKAKSGGSFPDLNKDGKITKADILKGRGVIAKKGAKVAKMAKCKYGCK